MGADVWEGWEISLPALSSLNLTCSISFYALVQIILMLGEQHV